AMHIGRVRSGYHKSVASSPYRNHLVLSAKCGGDQRHEIRIGLVTTEIHDGEPIMLGKKLQKQAFVDNLLGNQDVDKPRRTFASSFEKCCELIGIHEFFVDQYICKPVCQHKISTPSGDLSSERPEK